MLRVLGIYNFESVMNHRNSILLLLVDTSPLLFLLVLDKTKEDLESKVSPCEVFDCFGAFILFWGKLQTFHQCIDSWSLRFFQLSCVLNHRTKSLIEASQPTGQVDIYLTLCWQFLIQTNVWKSWNLIRGHSKTRFWPFLTAYLPGRWHFLP